MLQLEITALNGKQVSRQDFYVYPDDLTSFGSQLQAFPKSQTDVVSLEYGKEPKFYCYFLLRAIVLDSVGHAALEIKIDNRLEPPEKASSNFFMSSEIATINAFGKKISGWVEAMNTDFKFEWQHT